MSKKALIFIAMLVVAIVAMGSVSATENVTTDVAVPTEEVSVEDNVIEENNVQNVENTNVETSTSEYTQYTVTTSSDLADISEKIGNGTYTGYQFNFEAGTYNNFTMNTGNNNKFVGNGANIISGGDNLFTVTGSSNIVITGFNMTNAAGKAAVYGSNVVNFTITDNVINGGKDGINIFKSYENVTITDNTIYQVSRDAISLANPLKSDIDNIGESYIMNNVIYSGSSTTMEFGIFVGGTFKGTISGNNITNVDCAMQFAGKPTGTQGHLNVNITNNIISNVSRGIDMFHPDVISLLVEGNSITATNYSFNTNENFTNSSENSIEVIENVINGVVSQAFIDATYIASDNTGTDAYSKNDE